MKADLHRARQNQVELLAVVLGILQGGVRVALGGGDDEGLARAVLHADCLVEIAEAGTAHKGEAVAVTGDRVKAQVRRLAANDRRDVQAKVLRHIVVEREGCLPGTTFVELVLLDCSPQKLGHLGNSEVLLGPQLADTHRNLLFVFHVHLIHGWLWC